MPSIDVKVIVFPSIFNVSLFAVTFPRFAFSFAASILSSAPASSLPFTASTLLIVTVLSASFITSSLTVSVSSPLIILIFPSSVISKSIAVAFVNPFGAVSSTS